MTARLNSADKNFEAAFARLLDAKRENNSDVSNIVSNILEDVRVRGDEAVIELTRRFDHFDANIEEL